jgi:hypothetical protein
MTTVDAMQIDPGYSVSSEPPLGGESTAPFHNVTLYSREEPSR